MEKELNLLISRNTDASSAYNLAAELVENENFRSFLEAYSARREQFANDLKVVLTKMGSEINGSSTLMSSAHLGWMRLRLALPGSKDKDVLKECARAESRALKDYEQVLSSTALPNDIKELLMTQRDKILITERSLKDIAPLLKQEVIGQHLEDLSD